MVSCVCKANAAGTQCSRRSRGDATKGKAAAQARSVPQQHPQKQNPDSSITHRTDTSICRFLKAHYFLLTPQAAF